jgi:hypothetical protein
MERLIRKGTLVLLPVILANLVFGILRYRNGDKTIPFSQNWQRQYMTKSQIDLKIGLNHSDSQIFDMSREIRRSKLIRFKDKWGFQNSTDTKNPDVLFIGDSFFDDPHLSYDQGLTHNIPRSMNISSVGCSGFKVFNELRTQGYFTRMPKFIFIGVVERNLSQWSDLYGQIEDNDTKTVPYKYYYLDFVFGNNFSGANLDNLSLTKTGTSLKKGGTMRKLDDQRSVYFYKNSIAKHTQKDIHRILGSMTMASRYFNERNCRVVFIVAPDKESIFPEIYPKSNLPLLQKKFDSLKIEYIDMYKEIMQSPKRRECYYDGDTHWNQNAYELLLENIRMKMGDFGAGADSNRIHSPQNDFLDNKGH